MISPWSRRHEMRYVCPCTGSAPVSCGSFSKCSPRSPQQVGLSHSSTVLYTSSIELLAVTYSASHPAVLPRTTPQLAPKQTVTSILLLYNTSSSVHPAQVEVIPLRLELSTSLRRQVFSSRATHNPHKLQVSCFLGILYLVRKFPRMFVLMPCVGMQPPSSPGRCVITAARVQGKRSSSFERCYYTGITLVSAVSIGSPRRCTPTAT